MKTTRETFERHPVLFGLLSIFSLLFLIKGSIYLYIGSPIPFFIGVFVLLLLIIALKKVGRTSRKIIRVLGTLLILWGFSRLLIGILFAFVSLTEAHIEEQFTLVSTAVSIISLLSGIYVFRNAKDYISATE